MVTDSNRNFHFYEWETIFNANTLLLKVEAGEEPAQVDVRPGSSQSEAKLDRSPRIGKRLILIIPGNPGCIQFYQEFAVALWQNLGRATAVWGISHAGHVFHKKITGEVFDGASYPTLQFQIDHKRIFIEENIPADIEEIILIGHSIGAYISLRTAQVVNDPRISHVIGLFPTIERMALTPRGRLFTPLIRYGRWMLFALVFGFSWLPEWVRRGFFRRFFAHLTGHLYDGAANLSRLASFRNCILMAKDEMEQVDRLDGGLLEESGKHRVILYYGRNDHWCPQEFFTDISTKFPHGQFHLCQKGLDHAFVINDVAPMAELVSNWLKN